jgi:mono/diheme cytochrome c family protein
MEHAKSPRRRSEPKAVKGYRQQPAKHPQTARANWIKVVVLTTLGLATAALLITTLKSQRPGAAIKTVVVPDLGARERVGQEHFARQCQICHGENGSGSRAGPPLVHKIYEPSHHSDGAFVRAVRQGVTAHHWRFGHMPSLPAVTDAEIAAIIAYVRALQRANGIK